MELSPQSLEQLRDEALAALCREASEEQLELLERKREEIESTRSPFQIFARRGTKEAFTQSVREAKAGADAFRLYLAQVQEVERRLLPQLHDALDEYLVQASGDYQLLKQSVNLIDSWLQGSDSLSDSLLGFAREVREVRLATPGRQLVQAIAAAGELAQRLENAHLSLAELARQVGEALASAETQVHLPPLTELRRAAWVQRLTVLPAAQVAAEATDVEAQSRQFLAAGLPAARAQAQSCRALCQNLAERYLEQYWSQLRAYAREHYITGSPDLETVLQMLTVRYVTADLSRRQQELSLDPFKINR